MDAPRALVLDNTFGAAYIGAMVMMLLYGITTLQTYMYFTRFPDDGRNVKLLVLLVWVLDTTHVSLVSHAMYYYLITNYNNPEGLLDGTRTLYISVGFNVLIAFVVQCFFTQRLHMLSNKRVWMTSIISFFVLAHFCFGMETMAELLIRKRLDRISEITLSAAMPFAITAVLSDILIAGALCILLHNNKTSFRSTNAILNYLMVYAINRCLLTSVVAIVEVVMFAVMPHSFWFLAIDFVIGKLWANSLLATLNSRQAIRDRMNSRTEDPELDGASGQVDYRTGTGLEIGSYHGSTTGSRPRRSKAHEAMSVHFAQSSRSTGTATTSAPTETIHDKKLIDPHSPIESEVLEMHKIEDDCDRSSSRNSPSAV